MFDQLDALAALARHGTMASAGTALRISQSAMSKRLVALEARLGRKLLERHGRRARLTPEGQRILQAVTPLLAELRAIVAHEEAPGGGTLRLGVSESVLASWGAAAIAEARASVPSLVLEMHAHRSPVVVDRVRSGEYALGLVAGACEQAPDLDVELLAEEPMVVIPAGRRRLRRRPGALEVITIEPRSATWESIGRRARRLGLQPGLTLESFLAVGQLALQGFGHGLVPLGVARLLGVPEGVMLRPPGPALTRPIALVARRTTLARPLVRELRTHLARTVGRAVSGTLAPGSAVL